MKGSIPVSGPPPRSDRVKRHQFILAAVMALQVALCAIVFWPRAAQTSTKETLLADLQADDVVVVTLEDADGQRVSLRRSMGNWVLPEADDYPARSEEIGELLDKLVGLTCDRLVTQTPGSHQRLQVAADNFQRRIELESQDGARLTLYLGSSPAYGATHVRLEGQDETYLTSDLSTWEANTSATNWVESRYVDLQSKDILRLTVANDQGTFVCRQQELEQWTLEGLLEGETMDEFGVPGFVARTGSMTLLRPLGTSDKPEYRMSEPKAVATLELTDRTVTVTVGAQDAKDNSYVIKSSESPYYVRVSEYVVRDLIEYTREDLLEKPPSPTPETSQ